MVKVGASLPILAGMGLVSSLVTLPFLFFVPMPSGSVWLILVLSVALHAAYKVSLARTYSSADFTRAYPLARGLVPLFAAGLSYIWLNQLPSAGQFVGIVAIICGAVGLVVDRVSLAQQLRFLLAALGASLMVAGYSVIDAWGARTGAGWQSFTTWLIVIDSLTFLWVARLIQGPSLWSECVRAKAQILIAGILGVVAFAIFLWALSYNPVANVTAFRECSVLFGAVIGMTLLRERFTPKKLFCTSLIAAGLILIVIR
jgi:drug/metabolite transporter (DMT)-like permease